MKKHLHGFCMNGKEIVLSTLQCKPTERLPWVPFTGVHAGSFVGVDAEAFLKSADHIVSGLEAAKKRYQPDGLPVVFDLQLEAEVLGCTLAWAKETPPSVATHPLDDSCNSLVQNMISPKSGTLRGGCPLACR